MKKVTAILVAVLFVIAVTLSFFAGGYLRDREHLESRAQRCSRLILFAIDKVENMELSDTGVLEALISNLYAAHEFCDDPELSAELNDLWNSLIYRGDTYIGQEEALAAQLRSILERCQ